jgi:hypothetical protein
MIRRSDKEKDMKNDKALRQHLVELLAGGAAHAKFDDVAKGLPLKLRGTRPARFPHFSRNSKYVSPEWPAGYWPNTEAPPNSTAWNRSIEEFRKDLEAMQDLVANPKTDLFARIPWGDGQTILREALLLADHNAYHLGQLVDVRRLLGTWKD